MQILKWRGKDKYFPEIVDFPYAYTLSPEAKRELEDHLNENIAKYWRQKAFIARLLAKKEKAEVSNGNTR